MKLHYSSEKNIQILIALLKKYKITKAIVSPGSANANFVISIQQDPDFTLYSCIDERSAAYMACGLSCEYQEPIIICCTGATASRNYMPGLTEAYYRKLPVIAITATRDVNLLGMNRDQVIDRTIIPNDVSICSVHLPIVKDKDMEWECMIKINRALLELNRNGGGPIHINLTTCYSKDFSVEKLPDVVKINRFDNRNKLNELPLIHKGNVAVFVGAHGYWSKELTYSVDEFCKKYNAVVLCDQCSNYHGNYGVFYDLINIQQDYNPFINKLGTVIHIGEVSSSSINNCREVWRVNPDGELRDTFKKLTNVFQMDEFEFFEKYNKLCDNSGDTTFYNEWNNCYKDILYNVKLLNNELPFSSIWVALNTYDKLPQNSVLHLAILNSLRSWNYFGPLNNIGSFSNTGGFGIDGSISTVIGASLANTGRIYYLVVGDLAFFYDMNALGNRHIGNNIRILLINNGLGSEFKNNLNPQQQAGLGEDANPFVAAKGHYGSKSTKLVRNFAEDLGFNYYQILNKADYINLLPKITSKEIGDKPILCELFVDEKDDVKALEMIEHMKEDSKGTVKNMAKKILGDSGVEKIKRVLHK